MVRTFASVRPRQPGVRHRLVSRQALFVVAVSVAVTYVGLTNYVATQGYRLQSLQQEAARLQRGNETLQLTIAAEQSLQKLEAELPALALTPVAAVDYLATAAVAVR